MNPLLTPIDATKPKLTSAQSDRLTKLGIHTVEDLLFYPPRTYLDFTHICKITDLPNIADQFPLTLIVKIERKKLSRIRGRNLTITEILVTDSSGSLKIPFFNQPFLFESLKEGASYALTGIAKPRTKSLLGNPSFERILPGKELLHSKRLTPVYPETQGITSKFIRFRIARIKKTLGSIPDILPEETRKKAHLLSLEETFQALHYPKSESDIDQAQYRLAFNQILIVQLYLQKQKLQWKSLYAPFIPFHEDLLKQCIQSLPYSLTQAQRRATWEIIKDLSSQTPMNRLLEGDVGTGKTLVAVLAMLNVSFSAKQSALMAPTEVLAIQHFESIISLVETMNLDRPPRIALLTAHEARISTDPELGGWTSIKRSELQHQIKSGKISIIIGTHSLITGSIVYQDLALTIVDEQHRFGVSQRADLQKSISHAKDRTHQTVSHLLSMTATPIPRTLALSLYGDLSLSLLNEYPAGRKFVKTKLVSEHQRLEAYTFIRKHLELGRQAFVVCPKIESSSESTLKSVEETYQEMLLVFPQFRVAYLHGKMTPEEKDIVMKKFKKHEYDILVSTSVIEVGVDIPNATIMMIEGAERFGLAQLHQFRGRVGRGEHQSFCFLFETESHMTEMNQRLRALEKASTGFELADLDLALRGPGQFVGTVQSGLNDISMKFITHKPLIVLAKKIALSILRIDHSLSRFPYLKWKLSHFTDTIHFE